MNSHNTKADTLVRHESVRLSAGKEEVRVIESSLSESDELAISEDPDKGGDPYNSTGQHVIIKSRLALEE